MTPRLRAAINKIRGPVKLSWQGPDPTLVAGAREIENEPLDRAPWGVLADRAGEIEKPYFEHVLRTLFTTPGPTLDNQNILNGRLYVDPYKVNGSAWSSEYPTINGHIAGWPIQLNEDASGPFRVIFNHPDRNHNVHTDRLATLSVPRHIAAGLLHEMEPDTSWFGYTHHLEAARRRHPNPTDYPEYYADASKPVQMAKPAVKPDLETSHTFPERQYLEGASEKNLKTYEQHTKSAVSDKAPFGGVIPVVKTIRTLAEVGAPARGEYEKSFNTATDLLGHDIDGVPAWQAVNGVLSPQTRYLDHAGAASLIVANWLAMGKPKDPETIKQLVHRIHVFGKQYDPASHWGVIPPAHPRFYNEKTGRYIGVGKGETFGGTTAMEDHVEAVARVLSNIHHFRDILSHPDKEAARHLGLLSAGGGGLGKVTNFVLAYSAPHFGVPLDVHMSRLMFSPDLDNIQQHSDFLSQVMAQLTDKADIAKFNNIQNKALKGYPIKSELVKLLMKHSQKRVQLNVGGKLKNVSVAGALKEINAKLLSKQPYYMAYKNAIIEASRQMGWTPSEVQESVWTGIVALMAAKSVGIPVNKIQQYLTHDAVRQGWQNHEAFFFPGLADAYARAGTDSGIVRKLEQASLESATAHSRPGVIPVSDSAHLRRIIAYLPESNPLGQDAAGPIRRAFIDRLKKEGPWDEKTKRYKTKLAKYDAPLDFVSALQRAVSVNQKTFVEHLAAVLRQSGVVPHDVSPAVHDTRAGARVGVIATGSLRGGNQVTPTTGAAWTGLLGRQPGMLSFMANANGPDSVYRFPAQDADKTRAALDQAGVTNRVFTPKDKDFHVYVYDPGRRQRESIAQALAALGTPAEEWRGQGTPLGGKQEDMGREQYRTTINRAETQQAQQPLQFAGFSNFRGGAYSAASPGLHPYQVPTHYEAVNNWFEKNKKTHTYLDGAGNTQQKHYANLTPTKSIERDPEDGSLHVNVHFTPVVTLHPDNTYTLRISRPGQQYGGWPSRENSMVQSYFTPGMKNFRMPGFFNGIRLSSKGVPIHTISGKYNDAILRLVKEAHIHNTPAARTALNAAIHHLSPSWHPKVVVPPNPQGPNKPSIASLHDMMINRQYDPDSPAIPELMEQMRQAGKPYTAHALGILHGQAGPVDFPTIPTLPGDIPYHHLASGRIAGLPVALHTPTGHPGRFTDPSWYTTFGLARKGAYSAYSPVQQTPKPALSSLIPQNIAKGVLHEIDDPNRTGDYQPQKILTTKIKNLIRARKLYSSPGIY